MNDRAPIKQKKAPGLQGWNQGLQYSKAETNLAIDFYFPF